MSRKRSHEDDSADNVFVLYADTDPLSIPIDITSARIDSSVKKIAPCAFVGRMEFINVEYEEGIEMIGTNAFQTCTRLGEQRFPSTLVEICRDAFYGCSVLTIVRGFPANLKIIGKTAFKGCRKLKCAEIPNSCRLFDNAFDACWGLTNARLPEGMVSIPPSLFSSCNSLVDVKVPSSLIEIGSVAFGYCNSLTTINLPSGLKIIGSKAFHDSRLKHFHFPPTVEIVGEGVLANCQELESAILPPKLQIIPEQAFRDCFELNEIAIPKSVTHIGVAAFARCSLTHLDLSPCNLIRLGAAAFFGCTNLTNILLPRANLKRIERGTFEVCLSLTHLWIPPTVKHVDHSAFSECASLISVEMPEGLQRVHFGGNKRYNSLVNFCLPPSHEFDPDISDDESTVVEINWEKPWMDLKICYHTLLDNIGSIQNITKVDSAACSKVDFAGMNPFQVLGLSHIPCLDLFQELLSVSSVDITRCRDVFGRTPLDYLCKNRAQRAVDVTKTLVPIVLEPLVSFLGLARWREELQSGLEKVQASDAGSMAYEVVSVCQKLAVYEWMEVHSLLETTLWKMKVKESSMRSDQAGGAAIVLESELALATTRENCRLNCGINLVLTNVMPFLGSAT